MSAADELLSRHAASRRGGAPGDPLSRPPSGRPRLRLAMLTCMDARVDPARIFGIGDGEVHVIRNAGGIVTDDVIRSLVLSQRELRTAEVMVLQHTNCGLHGLRDADLRGRIVAEVLEDPPFDLGGFQDLDGSVRDGVDRLRATPWLPARHDVRGFVYDVDTGAVREVDTPVTDPTDVTEPPTR